MAQKQCYTYKDNTMTNTQALEEFKSIIMNRYYSNSWIFNKYVKPATND